MTDTPFTGTPDGSRYYAIGIPLGVEIKPDGSVTLDFDLSEIGDIIEDDDAFDRYGSDQTEDDAQYIETVAALIQNQLSATIHPANGGAINLNLPGGTA